MGNDFFNNKEDPLKSLADQGNIIACATLGSEYIAGFNRPANQGLGLHYTGKAAEAGYAASCLYLARYHYNKGEIDNSKRYVQLALDHKDDLSYDVQGVYSQKHAIRVIESLLKQHPEIRPAEHQSSPGLSKK